MIEEEEEEEEGLLTNKEEEEEEVLLTVYNESCPYEFVVLLIEQVVLMSS